MQTRATSHAIFSTLYLKMATTLTAGGLSSSYWCEASMCMSHEGGRKDFTGSPYSVADTHDPTTLGLWKGHFMALNTPISNVSVPPTMIS